MSERFGRLILLSTLPFLPLLACSAGSEVCVTTPTNICPGDLLGDISGSVVDNGLPLYGVTATLSGSQNQPVTSDSQGGFSFVTLPAGEYTVTISGYPATCQDTGGSFSRTVTVSDRQTTAVPFALSCSTAWASISAGKGSCGIRTTGLAYCWGRGQFGALGNGANVDVSTPSGVALTLGFVQIVSYFNHACGLVPGGIAYCWGQNTEGQLGTGNSTDTNSPQLVSGGLTFTSLGKSGCAIGTGGTGYCWGNNDRGQLGDGTNNASTVPVQVTGGLQFSSIGGGERHACGLTTGGDVYCWGENQRGQLGTGSSGAPENTPQLVAGGRTYAELSVGREFNCARTGSGQIWCWGRNADGQTGQPAGGDQPSPARVGSGSSWTSVSAGNFHACALQGSQAFCWGRAGQGQLGNGSLDNTSTPSSVSGSLAFDEIDGGAEHTCGLVGGVAYCWGLNDNGEVGDGTETLRSTPVQVVLSS